jgi:3-methyladenine DNA glycosylase/8-oxoguanine DNA glycosylase
MRQFETKEAAKVLSRVDNRMAQVIEQVGSFQIPLKPISNPFRTLTESIAYQQLHPKAASTILSRFRALYPGRRFPSPEDVTATPDDQMRGAGLSRAKTAAIKDLAAKVLDGTVPSPGRLKRMDDEESIEHLTRVRGIGRWTVEMLLIFGYGRPDVLPATDYGIQKGFAGTYRNGEMPAPKEILEYGEMWRPCRTTASLYLWRAVDTGIVSGD